MKVSVFGAGGPARSFQREVDCVRKTQLYPDRGVMLIGDFASYPLFPAIASTQGRHAGELAAEGFFGTPVETSSHNGRGYGVPIAEVTRRVKELLRDPRVANDPGVRAVLDAIPEQRVVDSTLLPLGGVYTRSQIQRAPVLREIAEARGLENVEQLIASQSFPPPRRGRFGEDAWPAGSVDAFVLANTEEA